MPQDKNAAKKERMIAAFTDGCTWEQAANRVGVDRKTLVRWCKADPELADRAIKARDAADDMVEAVVFNNCLDPDPSHNTLRMFWLKSRRRGVYGEKVEQEHKGGIKIQVNYADTSDPDHAAEAARGPTADPGEST